MDAAKDVGKCSMKKCAKAYKTTQEESARNVPAIKELLLKLFTKKISEAEFKKQTAAIRKNAMNTKASNDLLECQIESCKKELNKLVVAVQGIAGVKKKPTTAAEYKTFLTQLIR